MDDKGRYEKSYRPFFAIFQDRGNGIILDNLVKLGYYK